MHTASNARSFLNRSLTKLCQSSNQPYASTSTYSVTLLCTGTRALGAGQRVRLCTRDVRTYMPARDANDNRSITDKWLTLDSLCYLGFGKTLDLLRNPCNRFVIEALHSFSSVMGVYVQFPGLGIAHFGWLARLLPSTKAARNRYSRLSDELLTSAANASNDFQRPVLSRILNSADPRVCQNFPEPELWAEGVFLMLAGKIILLPLAQLPLSV